MIVKIINKIILFILLLIRLILVPIVTFLGFILTINNHIIIGIITIIFGSCCGIALGTEICNEYNLIKKGGFLYDNNTK